MIIDEYEIVAQKLYKKNYNDLCWTRQQIVKQHIVICKKRGEKLDE